MVSRLVAPIGFIVALVALAFVMQTLGSSSSPSTKPLTGSDLLKQYEVVEVAPPSTNLTDKDGKKAELPAFTKPTLLTFWSVNCGECETGLPLLDNFSKSQNQITVILIDAKDEPKDAEAKLQSLKVALGTFYDFDGSTIQSWEATTMPASYFVINGKVKYFFPGRISQEHLDALSQVN